jgi:hypothetical protein
MFLSLNETLKGKGFDDVKIDEQYAKESLLETPEIAVGRQFQHQTCTAR